jgi:hypothetical protein
VRAIFGKSLQALKSSAGAGVTIVRLELKALNVTPGTSHVSDGGIISKSIPTADKIDTEVRLTKQKRLRSDWGRMR